MPDFFGALLTQISGSKIYAIENLKVSHRCTSGNKYANTDISVIG